MNTQAMIAGLGGHVHEYRPHLQRTRSSTLPSLKSEGKDNSQTAPPVPTRPARPPHLRSHSYLSPVEAKPRNAFTLPTSSSTLDRAAEKIPILRSKHHNDRDNHKSQKGHRYTQSEAQQYHRQNHKNESLPHLMSNLEKEARRNANDRYGTDTLVPFVPGGPGGLMRITSNRSHRPHARDTQGAGPEALRRRATSDPKRPQGSDGATLKPKSSIDFAVEQAEMKRRQMIKNATKDDVERKKKGLEEAEDEMRENVVELGRIGQDITRRLDYSYYNLLEKLGGLVSTISSFRSLSQQSQQLMVNFDGETHRLEGEVKSKFQGATMGFDQREDQIKGLDERGKQLKQRAEDLGRRLENARTMVSNWEKREELGRQAWFRIMGMTWKCIGALIVLIIALLLAKEWWFAGDLVKAGLRVPANGNWNSSLALSAATGSRKVLLDQMDVPDEVKEMLKNIGEKNSQRKPFFSRPVVDVAVSDRQKNKEEQALKLLDNL